ncbi:sensor histidine kinase [Limnofasciculus baicalensis]|uniref:histidine kinase n=1 Tax=Limnofasciculus baicalensis BBK-W-15 TaxID=2699891 RepID=A0AAE3KKH4_9CYAN|nr:DICT sensory domain-containing protein [Limnofasciculus baicalensis]MCP2727079.1 ATP-binding protein [Limnofasciculus baicalensis BBK-W-15]
MTTPDFSIYQLTLDNLKIPQSLTISPLLLKSLVGAIFDILVEAKISATIWVKLPPEADWISKINQYQQQEWFNQKIYLCSCVENEKIEETDILSEETEVEGDNRIVAIQLGGGNQLKQELFLIVICEQFTSLIVAHPLPLTQPDTNRNDSYLAICTFDRKIIKLVMAGLKGAIADNNCKLLADWGNLFDNWFSNKGLKPLVTGIESFVTDSNDRDLLTQILIKQLQRTENILQSPPTRERSLPSKERRNKDEFLRRVAQELKTPLTNMKTAITLLDSPQLKPLQRQRYMELLHKECDRQNSLIAGFLDLVEIDEDPYNTVMPAVELAEIIPGIVSTYQPLAEEKGIQLGYTIPSKLPPVSCLDTWLRQITINLLNNSLKFTQTGGKVRVLASLQGEYVQVAFSDTGMGIAHSEIPKIFDSFYRGRPIAGEETGAGLGLTIVQQLLLRCGGSISVTSQLGKGATFKVLLPIAPT